VDAGGHHNQNIEITIGSHFSTFCRTKKNNFTWVS
jgi:hypothetical protein